MKFSTIRILFLLVTFGAAFLLPQARAGETNTNELRAQFFQLCDMAADKVEDTNTPGPFFAESYAVRALCVAYDMTGNQKYLDACRDWSKRMIAYQEQMTPPGAYYMHYNRKPGETNGDWYVADSSSIGMAVLATSVRCHGAEQKRFIKSAKNFANLVIKNYVKSSGGVSDGLWHESSQEWWNSSALFGSFLFNLYADTGDKDYLKTALHTTDWLNDWDLTKDQPFPLSQQGPAMIFYVMENYSAGWPYIEKDKRINKAALAKIHWCFKWISEQQQKPVGQRQWPATKSWGMKAGGLPFYQCVFARHFSDEKLRVASDSELRRLAAVEFAEKPEFTQLSVFMMMSYAERLDPGAIYKSKR